MNIKCYFCNGTESRSIKRGLHNKRIVNSCVACYKTIATGLETYQENNPKFTDKEKNFLNDPEKYI